MINTVFDKPGKFWRGNLHTHSTESDGALSPKTVCSIYQEAGYDFIALTDHFRADFDWPIVDTTPFRTNDFTTILGAELHTGQMEHGSAWHILGIGLPLDFAPAKIDETGPQIAQRALDAGAYVAAAHPQWYAMTEQDMLSLGSVHAIEIYNGSCHEGSDTAEALYMWDLMLARGLRYSGCANDDAHFTPDCRCSMMGWVMVKSLDLSPESLLTALKSDDYYSSTGAQIYDIQVTPGDKITIRCSPASRVSVLGIRAIYKSVAGADLMTVEFNLEDWNTPYVRVLIWDANGHKAWSNPIWFD